jgi:hypothetical protein
MTTQAKSGSRPWRRLPRFSVRGLVVFVLVIGGGLGWLVRSARIQRAAVAAITKAGGSVVYEWDRSNLRLIPEGDPCAPKWLVDLIGVDYFGHVASVDLQYCKGKTDALMAQVEPLTRLARLSLGGSTLSDEGLSHLTGLTNLSDLDLFDTRVSDAGLVHLKRLTRLSRLSVNGTRVTNAGLVHLEGLKNLSELELSRTKASDAGLVHLKGLTNLSFLSLQGTNVSNAGISDLQQDLPRLNISHGTHVSNAGIGDLQESSPRLYGNR